MVIEIPSESELSDATIILGCPIEEEDVESPEVQQPAINIMARARKKPLPMTSLAHIPTLGSHPVPNLEKRPLVVAVKPFRDSRQDGDIETGESCQP